MTKIIVALIALFSVTAFAQDGDKEYLNDDIELSSINVLGGKMSFMYSVGGGCDQHYAVVSAEVTGIKNEGHPILEKAIVQIRIQDTTASNQYDPCKSIVQVADETNLSYYVIEALKKAGRENKPGLIELVLPNLTKRANPARNYLE